MKIELDKREYNYLLKADFLSDEILKALSKFQTTEDSKILLDLSEDIVDQIHEEFEDRLQYSGFDKNYELTEEGMIVEGLLDKFFTG